MALRLRFLFGLSLIICVGVGIFIWPSVSRQIRQSAATQQPASRENEYKIQALLQQLADLNDTLTKVHERLQVCLYSTLPLLMVLDVAK